MRASRLRGGGAARLLVVLATLIVASLIGTAQASATDSLTPAFVNEIVPAGSTIHVQKTLHLDGFGVIGEVSLVVVMNECPATIEFSPPSYTNVTTPADLIF